LKDTFIDPLLHPYLTSPISNPQESHCLDIMTHSDSLREKTQQVSRGSRAGRVGALLRKFKNSNLSPGVSIVSDVGIVPHLRPGHLRKCLEVIEAAIIEGNTTLSQALRKRYDEQYPLVRSLADVFASHVRPCFFAVLERNEADEYSSHISFMATLHMFFISNGHLKRSTSSYQLLTRLKSRKMV
jgi:hypothetical protein